MPTIGLMTSPVREVVCTSKVSFVSFKTLIPRRFSFEGGAFRSSEVPERHPFITGGKQKTHAARSDTHFQSIKLMSVSWESLLGPSSALMCCGNEMSDGIRLAMRLSSSGVFRGRHVISFVL